MAAQEAFTLDGLALNDETTFAVTEVSWPPPRQRQEWIGAADSETQALFRNPLHENRKVTLRVAVLTQASMDLALAKIAQVLDKLQKASKYADGIGLVWTPATATLSCTFDVLAGEITDLPIDWESGWLALSPEFTVELTCKPYWRGTETLTATSTATAPLTTLEVPNVTGDVPALGRLIVTDTETQSRRFVEWGIEGPLTYNSGTSLIIDSDSLVTSGFAGTGTTVSDAYDPGAAGDSAIIGGAYLQPAALCGTGDQTHIGSFRVRARVVSALGGTAMFRLSWQAGDGPFTSNAWVTPRNTFTWEEHDLGTITIPAGSGRWTGRVEVMLNPANLGPLGTGVYLDYLTLIPVSDGYGKARAAYSYSAGVVTGYDQFTGATAAAALNARVAPAGGTWATSGAATDFAFADDLSGEQIKRSTSSDAGPRWAILGSTNYTDVQVESVAMRTSSGGAGVVELGVVARWTDSSNYLRLVAQRDGSGVRTLYLIQRVAGVDTTLASASIPVSWNIASANKLRLIVFSSGRVLGDFLAAAGSLLASVEASSTVLATAGTLATGKPGIYDYNSTASAIARYYDDFAVSTPAAEPIALYSGRTMQIRHETVYRDNGAGTYTGVPPSYRGGRFLLPVGTSRVAVLARRNDLEAATSANVTDSTRIQVGWTPRGLAVPR